MTVPYLTIVNYRFVSSAKNWPGFELCLQWKIDISSYYLYWLSICIRGDFVCTLPTFFIKSCRLHQRKDIIISIIFTTDIVNSWKNSMDSTFSQNVLKLLWNSREYLMFIEKKHVCISKLLIKLPIYLLCMLLLIL